MKKIENVDRMKPNFFVGDVVRLTGKTRHGKNRVRENGDMWEVISIDDKKIQIHAFFAIHSTKICVVPMMESRRENWRWLDIPEDEHMEFEIIDNEVVNS